MVKLALKFVLNLKEWVCQLYVIAATFSLFFITETSVENFWTVFELAKFVFFPQNCVDFTPLFYITFIDLSKFDIWFVLITPLFKTLLISRQLNMLNISS